MLLFLPLPGHFSCPAPFPIRRESSARRLTNGTERIGRSLDAAPNDECASHFYGGQAEWSAVPAIERPSSCASPAPKTTPGNAPLRCSVAGTAIANPTLITPKMRIDDHGSAQPAPPTKSRVSIVCPASNQERSLTGNGHASCDEDR